MKTTKMEKQNLIKLQSAHVNQHTKDGIAGDWKIEENQTNKAIGILPSRLNHNEVFSILDIARECELEAFQIGIKFGKEEQKKISEVTLNNYKERMQLAIKENERLASALETITNN